MYKLRNIHPGEILQEEFLSPMGLTAYRLSMDSASHKQESAADKGFLFSLGFNGTWFCRQSV